MRIYLAGPSVFRIESIQEGNRLKALCIEHGAVGLYPLDNEIESSSIHETALMIRKSNEHMMRSCDAAIADMTPFRGPGMDGGTAYEIGYMSALGKPVVAYSADLREYADKIKHGNKDSMILDDSGLIVENFGLTDNLMMSTYVSALVNNAEQAISYLVKMLLEKNFQR